MSVNSLTISNIGVAALKGKLEEFKEPTAAIQYIEVGDFIADKVYRIEVVVLFSDGTEVEGSGSSARMIQLIKRAPLIFQDDA